VFQVSVAWQGGQSGGAPPAGVPCGTGSYGTEEQRRAVSITLLPASS
jgi:type IV pilus assembly protein PilV